MSLTINTQNAEVFTISLEGRLDTATAPDLEKVIDSLTDTKELVFDFKGLQYISSAGLRVILKAQKLMNTKGKMSLVNVSPDVMEIFDMTGFTNFLTIL